MNAATAQYIQAHREETAAEIAAALAADVVTAQPMDRKSLAAHLLATGLNLRFRAAAGNEELPAELRAGITTLLDVLSWSIDYVGTNVPEHAATTAALVGGMVQAGVISAEESAALYGLAGGFRYDRLSEAEVREELDRLDAEDAAQVLRNRASQGYNAVVTAIDGGETGWETLAAVFAGAVG